MGIVFDMAKKTGRIFQSPTLNLFFNYISDLVEIKFNPQGIKVILVFLFQIRTGFIHAVIRMESKNETKDKSLYFCKENLHI